MKTIATKNKILFIILCLLISGVIITTVIDRRNGADSNQTADSIMQNSAGQNPGTEPAATPEPPARYYLALGDSIPAGYGVNVNERYPDLLFELFVNDDLVNKYDNFSESGLTSAMLLDMLKNLPSAEQEKIKDARIITINIGGNNILKPLINYLPDFKQITDMISAAGSVASDAMVVASAINEINTEVQNIMERFSFSDLMRIGEFIQRATGIFNDSMDLFNRMNELEANNPLKIISDPLPAELKEEIERGITGFELEFKEIIVWLEDNTENAVIIVNTLYNPIPDELLGLNIALSSEAETYTLAINNIIKAIQADHDFYLADVYTAFFNEPDLSKYMNYHLDLSQMNLNFDIIHPNNQGQLLIALLNYELLN